MNYIILPFRNVSDLVACMGDAIRRYQPECSYRIDGLHNHLDYIIDIFVNRWEIDDINPNVNFQECYGQFKIMFNPIILKVDIVITRLVLNIAPVYPARRRKSKITKIFVVLIKCY